MRGEKNTGSKKKKPVCKSIHLGSTVLLSIQVASCRLTEKYNFRWRFTIPELQESISLYKDE
jgi:hypothetical protein